MGKKSIALLVIFLILSVGLFFGWRYYTSPQYSLLRLQHAVATHDAVQVEKYVDLDAIIQQAASQVSSDWDNKFVAGLDGFGGLDPQAVNAAAAALGPESIQATLPKIREAVVQFVTGGPTSVQASSEEISDIVPTLQLGSATVVEKTKEIAVVDVAFSCHGEPVVARLTMRDAGSYWQFGEISDTGKTAQNIVAAYVEGERKRCEAERAAYPDRTIVLPGMASDAQPLVLAYVPAGKFLMGSLEDEPLRQVDETQHKVHITRPFWMSKYEITNGQFDAFVTATQYVTEPEKSGSEHNWQDLKYRTDIELPWDNLPVVRVTWNDAAAFAAWAAETAGETVALPTEAQWEYACRAGSTVRYCFGDAEDQLADYAWYTANSDWRGHPGGQKLPNAWGLHDMHGNVWEWCADWYGANYYTSSPKQDPAGPDTADRRVFRGGGWAGNVEHNRAAFRNWSTPDFQNDDVGFRVVVLMDEVDPAD